MTLSFDDEGTRAIERAYLTPDVVRQRAATLDLLAPARGERILDVGSGPGLETYRVHTLRTIATYVRDRLGAEEADAWRADVLGGDYFFGSNRYCVLAYKPTAASPAS